MLKERVPPSYPDQFPQSNQPSLGSDIYATPANGDGAALPDMKVINLGALNITSELVAETPATAGESDAGMDPKCSVENGQCA